MIRETRVNRQIVFVLNSEPSVLKSDKVMFDCMCVYVIKVGIHIIMQSISDNCELTIISVIKLDHFIRCDS